MAPHAQLEPVMKSATETVVVIDSKDVQISCVLDLSSATAQDLVDQMCNSGGKCDGTLVHNGFALNDAQSLRDAGVSDGDTIRIRPYSAFQNSSCIAQGAFWWASPLITLGAKRALVESDVWETADVDRVPLQVEQLEGSWDLEMAKASARNPEWRQQLRTWHAARREAESKKDTGLPEEPRPDGPSITNALLRVFKAQLIIYGLVKLLNDLVQYAPPLLIAALVSWAEGDDPDMLTGYIYALLYGAAIFSKSFLENQYFFHMTRVGINARAALMAMMYKKALRINLACGSDFGLAAGQIIQLMNTDTEFILQFTPQVATSSTMPVSYIRQFIS